MEWDVLQYISISIPIGNHKMPTNSNVVLTNIKAINKKNSFSWYVDIHTHTQTFNWAARILKPVLSIVANHFEAKCLKLRTTKFYVWYREQARPIYWVHLYATHSAPSMQINEQFSQWMTKMLWTFISRIWFIENTLLVTLEIISIIKRFRRSWTTVFYWPIQWVSIKSKSHPS